MKKILSFLDNRKTLNGLSAQVGFTMIELLVVIAVIGVLAVAVLSSINPIEQINKGRDTRTRSDAAQLINAVDRYFAIHEYYPWNIDNDGALTTGDGFTASVTDFDEAILFAGSGNTDIVFTPTFTDWDWIDDLVTTDEVKEGFTNRLRSDDTIIVYKAGTANATMYACFLPSSKAFKREAMDACNDDVIASGLDGAITVCASDPAVDTEDNWICLP